MNTTEDGICRTILATYHKIGTYNVFEHNFPAVMEVYEDGGSYREPTERCDHLRVAFRAECISGGRSDSDSESRGGER